MFKMTSNSNGITSVIKNPSALQGTKQQPVANPAERGQPETARERRASAVAVFPAACSPGHLPGLGNHWCRLPEPVR